jgi:4'-phosphopantetheinyl transferase EntD
VVALDESHIAVRMMRGILPEAVVTGGSFALGLPSPRTLSPDARRQEHARVRQMAMEQCVNELARVAALPAGTLIPHTNEGRRWPPGYVGSATDKGTVVAAALAPRTVLAALGIDIERQTSGRLSLDPAVIGTIDGAAHLGEPLATLVTFSVKEAVFKAQFAITRLQLSYTDIHISWTGSRVGELRGVAECPGFPLRYVEAEPA